MEAVVERVAEERSWERPRERERRTEADRWLLLVTVLLVAVGLVFVLSASQALAYLQHLSTLYYFQRPAVFVALGGAAMLVLISFCSPRLKPMTLPATVLVRTMPVPLPSPDGLLHRTGPAVSCGLVSFAGEGRASGPNNAAATLRSGESSPQSCRADELEMDHFMEPLAVHRTERS